MAILGGPTNFDPNEGVKGMGKSMLPSLPDGVIAFNIDQYVNYFQKALGAPPNMQSFANISYMPEMHNSGVIQWPGVPPTTLAKTVQTNLSPQLIIGMRVADVARYSTLSSKPWKPGWRIELREAKKHPSDIELSEIREAEQFLLNCNIEIQNARSRDAHKFTSLRQFLSMLTRNTLTYDGMAIWTDMDDSGRVKAFKCLNAGNIRLTGPHGYQGDENKFAVAVDEAGNVLTSFTRENLTWYVRNPRADPEIWGYGLSEIEIGIKLIEGFQNAIDMNAGTFTKNSTPNGMLLVKGTGWVQRHLDVLARMWKNLKSGPTKEWALPVVVVPKDGEVEVLDLTNIKGKEAYYQDWINMAVGAFCTVYRFPPHRLGYRVSGNGPDSELPNQTANLRADEEDPGIEELLTHIEIVINEYILWSRYPHLQFTFSGKNPQEDAREYEARVLAMTVNERRALADLPTVEDAAKEYGGNPKIAELVGNAPTDPSLTGIYQAAITAVMGSKAVTGNLMEHKIDPAESEKHGHASGVRRDSAKEKR